MEPKYSGSAIHGRTKLASGSLTLERIRGEAGSLSQLSFRLLTFGDRLIHFAY